MDWIIRHFERCDPCVIPWRFLCTAIVGTMLKEFVLMDDSHRKAVALEAGFGEKKLYSEGHVTPIHF